MKLVDIEKIKPSDFHSVEIDGLDVVRFLNTLPAVTPESLMQHGKWTGIDASYWSWKPDGAHPVKRVKYKHDECGRVVSRREPYCPNCGAKMQE